MSHSQLIALLFAISLVTSVHAEAPSRFAQERSLAAADKMLADETDPLRRSQIFLRWLKLKDEMQGPTPKAEDKTEILTRLQAETDRLEQSPGLDLQIFYKQLAYRYLEIETYEKSAFYFNKLAHRTPEDELTFGDALIGSHMANLAFEAYQRATVKEELQTLTAYKRGWANVQLQKFPEAMASFDSVLAAKGEANRKLREMAFRDRVIPYVENFSKDTFDAADASELRLLAQAASDSPAIGGQTEELYQQGLIELVKRFSEKGELARAESAFKLVAEGHQSELALLEAAPLWLKAYRAGLKHADFENLIKQLPQAELDPEKYPLLASELVQSTAFYDALSNEGKGSKIKSILRQTYEMTFKLFPHLTTVEKADVDAARFHFASTLLAEKKNSECVSIISQRSKKTPEKTPEKIPEQSVSLEDKSAKLEAQCRLKELDQLYAQEKTEDRFAQALAEGLLEKKIYSRNDLGTSSEKIFDGLSRMLMGGLKREPSSEALQKVLSDLLAAYPFATDSALYKELHHFDIQLKFQRLVAKAEALEAKDGVKTSAEISQAFFDLAQIDDGNSNLSQMSLQNSIVLAGDESIFSRCDFFQKTYAKKFRPKQVAFDRCVAEAEAQFDLAREKTYWQAAEKVLDRDQKLRLGLLELALQDPQGETRLQNLKTQKAKTLLSLWASGPEKSESTDSAFVDLANQTKTLLASLTDPLKRAPNEARVASAVKTFEQLDRKWISYFSTQPGASTSAKIFYERAQMTALFAEWLIPNLSKLKVSSATQAKWKQRAEARSNECSENAYMTSVDFHPGSINEFCPEKTSPEVEADLMKEWNDSRSHENAVESTDKMTDAADEKAAKFLAAAKTRLEKTPFEARYLLIRASDLSVSPKLSAEIQIALAKLTGDSRFWTAALALDGNQHEALNALLKRAEGNPFFERLYRQQINAIENIKTSSRSE